VRDGFKRIHLILSCVKECAFHARPTASQQRNAPVSELKADYMTMNPDKATAVFLMELAKYLKKNLRTNCRSVRIYVVKTAGGEYTNAIRVEVNNELVIRTSPSKTAKPLNKYPIKDIRDVSLNSFMHHTVYYLETHRVTKCYALRIFNIRNDGGAGYSDVVRVTCNDVTIGEAFMEPWGIKGLEEVKYNVGKK